MYMILNSDNSKTNFGLTSCPNAIMIECQTCNGTCHIFPNKAVLKLINGFTCDKCGYEHNLNINEKIKIPLQYKQT